MKTDRHPPLCGIEFFYAKDCEDFLLINPRLRQTTLLSAGDQIRILLFRDKEGTFPTRDTIDVFDRKGRMVSRMHGPDALELIYDIHDPYFQSY